MTESAARSTLHGYAEAARGRDPTSSGRDRRPTTPSVKRRGASLGDDLRRHVLGRIDDSRRLLEARSTWSGSGSGLGLELGLGLGLGLGSKRALPLASPAPSTSTTATLPAASPGAPLGRGPPAARAMHRQTPLMLQPLLWSWCPLNSTPPSSHSRQPGCSAGFVEAPIQRRESAHTRPRACVSHSCRLISRAPAPAQLTPRGARGLRGAAASSGLVYRIRLEDRTKWPQCTW